MMHELFCSRYVDLHNNDVITLFLSNSHNSTSDQYWNTHTHTHTHTHKQTNTQCMYQSTLIIYKLMYTNDIRNRLKGKHLKCYREVHLKQSWKASNFYHIIFYNLTCVTDTDCIFFTRIIHYSPPLWYDSNRFNWQQTNIPYWQQIQLVLSRTLLLPNTNTNTHMPILF
jgi:hypothetical protein